MTEVIKTGRSSTVITPTMLRTMTTSVDVPSVKTVGASLDKLFSDELVVASFVSSTLVVPTVIPIPAGGVTASIVLSGPCSALSQGACVHYVRAVPAGPPANGTVEKSAIAPREKHGTGEVVMAVKPVVLMRGRNGFLSTSRRSVAVS